jgi:arginine transport system substrate-binding protein
MKKLLPLFLTLFLCNTLQAQPEQVVRFASEATYPPFEFLSASGELQGFDIDIAKAVCAQAALKCKFSAQPWENLITGLELGKFDAVINAMDITDERKKRVDFSEPYFSPTGSFIARKSADLSITPLGLKGKVVGAQKGTTFEKYLKQQYKKIIILKTYPNFNDALLDLKADRLDAAIIDTPALKDWLQNNDPQHHFTLVGEPIQDPEFFGVGYGIAVKKGNIALLNKINQGLSDIKKNGTYEKIFSKYFPGTN